MRDLIIGLLLLGAGVSISAQTPETVFCPVTDYFKQLDQKQPWQAVFRQYVPSGYPPKNPPSTAAFNLTAGNKNQKFTGGLAGIEGAGIKPFANQNGYPIPFRFCPVYFPKGINDKTGEMSYGSDNHNHIDGFVTDGLNLLGWGTFRQTDPEWADELYGHSSTLTIKKKGCCMTSATNIMHFLGFDGLNPSTMNAALQNRRNGYLNVLQVNHEAVARIAQESGYDIHFKRNLGVDNSIARRCGTMCTVKGGRHFVGVPEHRSDNKHVMVDPAGPNNILEWYWGVSQNTTRSYYIGNGGKAKTAFGGVDFADSAIVACCPDDQVTISLHKGDTKLDEGEIQEIEDDETGEVSTDGVILDYTGAEDQNGVPFGNYKIVVAGQAGAKVKLLEYSRGYEEIETNLTIGPGGSLIYEFRHDVTAYLSDVGGLGGIDVGAPIEIGSGIVTAKVPGGFYLQARYDRTPAVYVKWPGEVRPAHAISKLLGRVREENGRKYIEATAVELKPDIERAKPVGVAAEKAEGTFNLYLRTCGMVNDSNINGCLPIAGIAIANGWHIVQGVFHQGTLYSDLAE